MKGVGVGGAKQGASQRSVGVPKADARSVVLGTAGHVDHGKTSLVLALTGTDTDRLPEEKSRGITIDLGFAAMRLLDAMGRAVELSVVDVPGHAAFVRNMLAGAGGIDCVMLVVAADDGVKAQTREHLQICALLGVTHGLVALTKTDAVGEERLRAAEAEIRALVDGTFLEGAPVLPVSARTGAGLGALRAGLAQLVSEVPERSRDMVTRLPVDRAFAVRGFGTVVTGTLQGGTVHADDALQLVPSERSVRVRGIEVHGEPRREVAAPGRVALNLAGVDVGEVHRGDVLVPNHTLGSTKVLDVELAMLPGMEVRHRSQVRVHAYAFESLATVLLYSGEGGAEAPGNEAARGPLLARLRLARAVVLVPGDRFVLRKPSPARTVGGGVVLDAQPLPAWRKAVSRAWLQRVRDAGAEERVWLRVERRGVQGVELAQLVAETGMEAGALGPMLARGVAAGKLAAPEGSGARPEAVLTEAALVQAAERIERELGKAREKTVAQAELRSRVKLTGWVFGLALERLRSQGKAQVRADGIALPGQEAAQDGRAATVAAMYAKAGLASPLVSEVAERLKIAPQELRAMLRTMLRAQTLVRLGDDNLLVDAGAVERLVSSLRNGRGERWDVARFKSLTGLTRKHAIPLLEYLDGARVFRQEGNVRVVV